MNKGTMTPAKFRDAPNQYDASLAVFEALLKEYRKLHPYTIGLIRRAVEQSKGRR